MTLCTHVFVCDQVEPMRAFDKCRDLLGATLETETTLRVGEEGWTVGNRVNQGLSALLYVSFRPDGPLRPSADEDYGPACWLDLSFDTGYAYAGPEGEDCGRLHARLVAELGSWLDGQGIAWQWKNEFTGEVFDRYDRLQDLAGGGEATREWFSWVVRPLIEKMDKEVTAEA